MASALSTPATPIFIAIDIDFVASRRLPSAARDSLQAKARAFVAATARRRQQVARPVILLGDEMQFLVTSHGEAIELLWRAFFVFHPHAFRAGLGVGALSTALGRKGQRPTSDLDGPCFHAARRAVEEARAHKTWVRCDFTGERRGGLDPYFLRDAFNELGALQTALLEQGFSRPRLEALRLYWEGATVTEIAAVRGKGKGTASTLLGRASARELRLSARRQKMYLRELMRTLWGG